MTEGVAVPSKGGRPKQSEILGRLERLLGAAARVFLEQGYNGASIDAIARAAGVSKKTIYARFKDKADLFNAVWGAISARLFSDALPDDDDLPLAEGLERRTRALLEILITPAAWSFTRMMHAEAPHTPELVAYMRRYAGHMLDPFARYFENQMRRGALPPADARRLSRQFIYLLYGDLEYRLALAMEPPDAAEVAATARELAALFLDGARKAAPPAAEVEVN
jgi:AcrR family transcriptional regulator